MITTQNEAAATQRSPHSALADYELKPFDLVLFAGTDAVAKFIKKITLHEVVPSLAVPFHRLWTHAGMVIDKSVLPLECLEDNKLYIYESIFAGELLGLSFSKVLAIDHKVEPGGNHLGPQIRDLEAVVNESDCDIGICPLSPESRVLVERHLAADGAFMMDAHKRYFDYGYPMTNLTKVIGSASDQLYRDLKGWSKTLGFGQGESKEIFCSELVSQIYKEMKLPTFADADPARFSPLEVEVANEFSGLVFYAKEGGRNLLENGRRIPTSIGAKITPKSVNSNETLHTSSSHWLKIGPSQGVPERTPSGQRPTFGGLDIGGQELYLARASIGNAVLIGKIQRGWDKPVVSYFDREVPIGFEHELLVSYEGLEWRAAENGVIPEGALPVGREEDGKIIYAARGELRYQTKQFLGLRIGKEEITLCLGKISEGGTEGAHMTFDGDLVFVKKYQVLSLGHDQIVLSPEILELMDSRKKKSDGMTPSKHDGAKGEGLIPCVKMPTDQNVSFMAATGMSLASNFRPPALPKRHYLPHTSLAAIENALLSLTSLMEIIPSNSKK
ncbi:hypothetical protein HDU80_004945 [Chytriomyces hyalinus]|nr:hypothetical protein HDU80_004945 [Chytriomyces hyalinus]